MLLQIQFCEKRLTLVCLLYLYACWTQPTSWKHTSLHVSRNHGIVYLWGWCVCSGLLNNPSSTSAYYRTKYQLDTTIPINSLQKYLLNPSNHQLTISSPNVPSQPLHSQHANKHRTTPSGWHSTTSHWVGNAVQIWAHCTTQLLVALEVLWFVILNLQSTQIAPWSEVSYWSIALPWVSK
jgi:hypothetical protein